MYEGPNHWCLGQENPCSLSPLNTDATSFYLHQLSFCLCKRPESQGGVTAPCLAWMQCICQFCKYECWCTAHDSIVQRHEHLALRRACSKLPTCGTQRQGFLQPNTSAFLLMLCNRDCVYADSPDRKAYYLELSHSSQTIGQAVEQAALYAVRPEPPFVQPLCYCSFAASDRCAAFKHSSGFAAALRAVRQQFPGDFLMGLWVRERSTVSSTTSLESA